MTKDAIIDDICKAFEWGIDYGLLLAEQERDGEDLLDALGCAGYARKRCAPSPDARRRQPHSAQWREAKKKAVLNFIDFCGRI
jgi:hypothetical protein